MAPQGKIALFHFVLSVLLYIDNYQYHVVFLPEVFKWMFLALISPIGTLFLPFGITYCCSVPHPVDIAIMGVFFAINSYAEIFLACKILTAIRLSKQFNSAPELLFLACILQSPFFFWSTAANERQILSALPLQPHLLPSVSTFWPFSSAPFYE